MARSDAERRCAALVKTISYKYHCVADAMLNRCLFLVSGDVHRDDLAGLLDKALPPGACFYGLGDPRRGPELYLCHITLSTFHLFRLPLKIGSKYRSTSTFFSSSLSVRR
jgi:hypothetical protein